MSPRNSVNEETPKRPLALKRSGADVEDKDDVTATKPEAPVELLQSEADELEVETQLVPTAAVQDLKDLFEAEEDAEEVSDVEADRGAPSDITTVAPEGPVSKSGSSTARVDNDLEFSLPPSSPPPAGPPLLARSPSIVGERILKRSRVNDGWDSDDEERAQAKPETPVPPSKRRRTALNRYVTLDQNVMSKLVLPSTPGPKRAPSQAGPSTPATQKGIRHFREHQHEYGSSPMGEISFPAPIVEEDEPEEPLPKLVFSSVGKAELEDPEL
ncbi:hypothetical protein CYLTODRAFT_487287 [Cylindrobasidium torrendii FP15055 ss-10]|uniref:Uncharacterized protein n=1 Tax=Cylindrobasidium torrendii FP15055 ss-10 TaxID=1314674 RepID=A0A0D7BMI3_9AGAR|nr:hypothetical protein CYLTODRAFT_487287 [Cylindrobasidium torrendii FP15055 ss-10]